MPTAAQNVPFEVFTSVLKSLLFPLLPGTDFVDESAADPPRKNRAKLVTQFGSPTRLKLMPHKDSGVCCAVHRAQAFTQDEIGVIRTFLDCMERYYRDWSEPFAEDTAASVMSEVVSKSVNPDAAEMMARVVSSLLSWAEQTYEGRRIAFSLGVEVGAGAAGVGFESLVRQDFLKVMGNGQDTMLVFSETGQLVRHEALPDPGNPQSVTSPMRFHRVAWWACAPSRLAVVLNRNGELLVFRRGCLCFARRRGKWRYFAHEAAIRQLAKKAMARKSDARLRREIYLTALDAAFSRTGACIGVMNASLAKTGITALIEQDDLLTAGNPVDETKREKNEAIRRIVDGRFFQDLDRRLRSELAAMDGALILDHRGRILASGVILRIPGGAATGGGRETASIALAEYGLGIKVSSDGYIRVRNRERTVIAELG